MSDIEGVHPVSVLPDRLEVAEFSATEMRSIIGKDEADERLSRDNFNWMGAYLVEQVGLFEHEVADWFKHNVEGLEGERPLDVWGEEDGFERVFDYAKA